MLKNFSDRCWESVPEWNHTLGDVDPDKEPPKQNKMYLIYLHVGIL